jgi:hypothetical protein
MTLALSLWATCRRRVRWRRVCRNAGRHTRRGVRCGRSRVSYREYQPDHYDYGKHCQYDDCAPVAGISNACRRVHRPLCHFVLLERSARIKLGCHGCLALVPERPTRCRHASFPKKKKLPQKRRLLPSRLVFVEQLTGLVLDPADDRQLPSTAPQQGCAPPYVTRSRIRGVAHVRAEVL